MYLSISDDVNNQISSALLLWRASIVSLTALNGTLIGPSTRHLKLPSFGKSMTGPLAWYLCFNIPFFTRNILLIYLLSKSSLIQVASVIIGKPRK